MAVSDLLQFLAAGRKSGTLKFARSGIVKQIFLGNGAIVGSASNDPKEAIGQVLLHYGKITEEQLREGNGHVPRVRRSAGLGFVGPWFCEPGRHHVCAAHAHARNHYDLFIWEEAEFEFFDGEPFPADMIRINVDATSVIMDAFIVSYR